jgi:glycerol uptake facilitator-like aquaporin
VEENVVDVDIVNIEQPAEVEFDEATVTKKTFSEKMAALRPGALIAEFLGTAVLVGLFMTLIMQGTIGALGVGIGLAVLVMVFAVVSGAHFNPAITIAQWVNRKVDGVKATSYIIAQVLGAILMMVIINGAIDATNSTYKKDVQEALVKAAGVTDDQIKDDGGLEKFLKNNYGMTVDAAAGQLGIEGIMAETTEAAKLPKNQEWLTFLMEILGAVVFGLGIGFAFFTRNKSSIEKGLAVGVSLFAGLMIGGAAVILNPAVAAAIGGFAWANPFGPEAMVFWWPVFIYIFGTTAGITAGFTTYRFVLKDVVAKK